MNETEKINNCERAGELVAYFYGEATRAERESFDAHLARCGACRAELAAFAGVRESVGHWRAEIFDHAPAFSFADTFAAEAPGEASSAKARVEGPGAKVSGEARRAAGGAEVAPGEAASAAAVPHTSAPAGLPRRTALAALREFFTLTPAWLRAGLVAAALVVCALVGLAVVNAELRWDNGGLAFSTRLRRVETQTAPPASQPPAPAEKVYTQADLDKLAAERDAALRELEDTRAQLDDSREANLIAAAARLEPASASVSVTPPANSRVERREARAPAAARPKRQRDERDEEDVPRLYDLLTEAN